MTKDRLSEAIDGSRNAAPIISTFEFQKLFWSTCTWDSVSPFSTADAVRSLEIEPLFKGDNKEGMTKGRRSETIERSSDGVRRSINLCVVLFPYTMFEIGEIGEGYVGSTVYE